MKYIKLFDSINRDEIEDYFISIVDLGFKLRYIGAEPPNYLEKYSFKSKPFSIESHWRATCFLVEKKLLEVENELFLSAKRIIPNVTSFYYKTIISSDSIHSGLAKQHLSGYIRNDKSFMGYHSQKGQLIPKCNYTNASAVPEFFIKNKPINDDCYIYIEVEIQK